MFAAAETAATLPGPICTLIYLVAIIASVLTAVGLILSLFGGRGNTTRTGLYGLLNWPLALVVAVVTWVLYMVLC